MKWFIYFAFGNLMLIFILLVISEVLDPYGLKDTKNKRIENLNSEHAFLYPFKIESNAYYVIGTSRTLAFDMAKIENYTKKKTYFLGISGSNIDQWLFLIKRIKEKKSNIILGLDLFSLNQNNKNIHSQAILDEAFSEFDSPKKYLYFFNANFIQTVTSTIVRDLFTPRDHLFITQNSNNTQKEFEIIYKPYQNFELASKQINQLSAFLSTQDIVLIFPEYWKYYPFYLSQRDKNSKNLLDLYIQAIKSIAEKSDAQIWIFAGINSVTLEDKNFDFDYWHFKPKVGDLIINKIFMQTKQNQDFGFKVNRDEINKQLDRWKNQILSH